tara:strand:- start:221201 stop:222763 length:1563 start_codon:yes stop_codon:yes gene_type:complete
MLIAATFLGDARGADESDYYKIVTIAAPKAQTDSRSANWTPAPEGLTLEVSGIAILDDHRIAVAIRKGEVWLLDGVYQDPPSKVSYHQFASALHEPLGLLRDGDSLITTQRTEVTRMRDLDGDDVADEYETVASGWGVTGHYHEYAYGPERDGDGNLWITLNIGLGLNEKQRALTVNDPVLGYRQGLWRGWGLTIAEDGKLIPVCGGMRSPSGLGTNAAGDMFYTDQQGNWVATNSLHHMRPGAFFHHAEALASKNQDGSPFSDAALGDQAIKSVPDGLAYPQAMKRFPQLCPPAVWFPYKKMGQSATDIMLDDSDGEFGPFAGQLFVGEFTQAAINRVFLEKVDGQYQGACFPFRSQLASAVLRLAQGTDGSVFVGLTNRGWSSLGTASYGLQRLVWTGVTPFEIQQMRATPDGFELRFTKPVDVTSASEAESYEMTSYTYSYHETYGSNEINTKNLAVQVTSVSDDRKTVHLRVDGRRELFVHELIAAGVRSEEGEPLLHKYAYYTLNRIPTDGLSSK